jgi:hypothetical protein
MFQKTENEMEKLEFTATANHSKRTFTLRKKYECGGITKYRTEQFSKEEFNCLLNNTANDWKDYLKTSQNYFKIK